MSFPEKVTVGALMSFFQEELKKGNIDEKTPVFLEVYVLSREEELLKPYEEELGYHVPDDNMTDVLNFRMGVWQGHQEGTCRSDDHSCENTVALACYFGPKDTPFIFEKVVKESVNADGKPYK